LTTKAFDDRLQEAGCVDTWARSFRDSLHELARQQRVISVGLPLFRHLEPLYLICSARNELQSPRLCDSSPPFAPAETAESILLFKHQHAESQFIANDLSLIFAIPKPPRTFCPERGRMLDRHFSRLLGAVRKPQESHISLKSRLMRIAAQTASTADEVVSAITVVSFPFKKSSKDIRTSWGAPAGENHSVPAGTL
jgi:hypothetical protein